MSDAPTPVAGWYADPEDSSGERWWNGVSWSDHRRASTVGDATAPPAPASVVAPVVAPEPTGFRFGSPAAAGRPDPYAPPPVGTGYAPASPYVAAPYGAPAYGSTTNGLAIGGLIASIAGFLLGFLAAIAGIILSAFALSQAKQREAAGNPNSGRGMAMAGLVVGIVALAIHILIFVAYFAFVLSIGYPS